MKYKEFLERQSDYSEHIYPDRVYDELSKFADELDIEDFFVGLFSGQTVRVKIHEIFQDITLADMQMSVIFKPLPYFPGKENPTKFSLKFLTKSSEYQIDIHCPLRIWKSRINIKNAIEDFKIKLSSEKFGI